MVAELVGYALLIALWEVIKEGGRSYRTKTRSAWKKKTKKRAKKRTDKGKNPSPSGWARTGQVIGDGAWWATSGLARGAAGFSTGAWQGWKNRRDLMRARADRKRREASTGTHQAVDPPLPEPPDGRGRELPRCRVVTDRGQCPEHAAPGQPYCLRHALDHAQKPPTRSRGDKPLDLSKQDQSQHGTQGGHPMTVATATGSGEVTSIPQAISELEARIEQKTAELDDAQDQAARAATKLEEAGTANADANTELEDAWAALQNAEEEAKHTETMAGSIASLNVGPKTISMLEGLADPEAAYVAAARSRVSAAEQDAQNAQRTVEVADQRLAAAKNRTAAVEEMVAGLRDVLEFLKQTHQPLIEGHIAANGEGGDKAGYQN